MSLLLNKIILNSYSFTWLTQSLSLSLSTKGRWGLGGGSATGRHVASTAARWCAAAGAMTRHGSAGPPSVSASSTGAAPCAAKTATRRSTCTPVRAKRENETLTAHQQPCWSSRRLSWFCTGLHFFPVCNRAVRIFRHSSSLVSLHFTALATEHLSDVIC